MQTYNRKEQLVSFLGIGSYLGRRKNQGANRGIVHLRDITNLAADKRPAIVVKGQTGGNQVSSALVDFLCPAPYADDPPRASTGLPHR